MQKRLITLAVATVLAMPLAAQAGVEVYGKARMSLDYIKNGDPAPANDSSALAVSSNVSRMGFKGDEDLGNGLKLLWQIEQRVDFDTGTFSAGARNTFAGLGGGFGTLLAGRNDMPLRVVTQRIDSFADTKGDYNAIIGNIAGKLVFDNRFSNTLIYTSPTMSGFQVSAGYTPSRGNDTSVKAIAAFTDSTDDLPRTALQGKRDAASVSGSYNSGPLYLALAYETLGKYANNVDNAKAYRLGGSWVFPQGTTVGGVWEKADKGGTNGDRNAWYLNAAHKMGYATLKAAVARADDLGNITDSGATQFTLGAAYALSKATEVYALYSMTNNDKNGAYGLWSGSQAVAGFPDKSASALSVGVNHTFSSK